MKYYDQWINVVEFEPLFIYSTLRTMLDDQFMKFIFSTVKLKQKMLLLAYEMICHVNFVRILIVPQHVPCATYSSILWIHFLIWSLKAISLCFPNPSSQNNTSSPSRYFSFCLSSLVNKSVMELMTQTGIYKTFQK